MSNHKPNVDRRVSLVNKKVVYLIQKRKQWRQRALSAAVEFATYPAGKPGRDEVARELEKCTHKIRTWFRGAGRAEVAVSAIQRRAISAYRATM